MIYCIRYLMENVEWIMYNFKAREAPHLNSSFLIIHYQFNYVRTLIEKHYKRYEDII